MPTPMMTRSTDFLHPTSGMYVLTGWREPAWGTARFSLILMDFVKDDKVVFENADWPTAWTVMAGTLYKASRLADLLHSVLPVIEVNV